MLVAVSFAFATEAPVWSKIAPAMAPCSTWAAQINALATAMPAVEISILKLRDMADTSFFFKKQAAATTRGFQR
jgi:hypothetical protein